MGRPQIIIRELIPCDSCGALHSFRWYAKRGRYTYLKCKCGRLAVRHDVPKLRLIRNG
jgi:hypothetical protein